jgi:two-component system NtrC family response regulator
MKRIKILVIDDDESLRRVLEYNLAQEGYAVLTAGSGEQGLDLLKKEGADLVVTDVRMPGMDGLQVMEAIRRHDPNIQVIILTAFGTIEMAVEAMKAGAFHYISKPFNRDELKLTIRKALQLRELERENVALRQALQVRGSLDQIVAESPRMREIVEMVKRVAPTETTVFILGESGTGKELVARAIHNLSPRAKGPFVPVNCAAIPEHLLESELFGHVRGAFTGAIRDRVGKFEAADGGTIFLDEVGEMRPDLQVKILRVLEERVLERVGGNRQIRVDVRVLAATNKDLGKAIQSGEFREDLYYRLNVVPLAIPPLRERREDIRPLIQHFLRSLGAPPRLSIAPDAFRAMESYPWPGNVRELENALERALIFQRGDSIGLADLPETIRAPRAREAPALPVELPADGLSLEGVEKELILRALEKHDWNQSRAARYLGITRHTLLYRMEKHGIARPGRGGAGSDEEKGEGEDRPGPRPYAAES